MKKFKKIIVKIIMFICSYLPLYLLLIVSNFNYLIKYNTGVPYIVIITSLLFLILISIYSIKQFLSAKTNADNVLISNVQKPNDTLISYIATYILPMTSIKFGTDYQNIFMNILFFVIIGILYTKLGLVYLNPVLIFFNYRPYETDTKIIFSNLSYEKVSQPGIYWKSVKLASGVYIIRKKDNSNALK